MTSKADNGITSASEASAPAAGALSAPRGSNPGLALAETAKGKAGKALLYVWTAIGAIILCGVVVYLLQILSLPVAMLLWTLIFVFCLRGIVASLEARGVKRIVGTIVAYVVMFAFVGLVGFLMFSPVFGLNDQFANLVSNIPGYVDGVVKWGQGMMNDHSDFFNNDTVKSAMSSLGGSLSSWASDFASNAANTAVGVGAGVANAFMVIGFALVIAFWILLELPAIGREATRVMSPRFRDQAEFLHLTFTRILGGYIKGTLLQCFIIGVACGILFAVIGLPDAPALGVITGTLNIIPIIGPWVGGLAAGITALMISPITALIAIIGTIVIQQFVYTFVSPKIMSNSVDIHPVLTLVAMMLGSAVGGAMNGIMGSLVGMLMAIPAVAVIKACFVFYFERATGRQIVSEDGFIFKGTPSHGGAADPFYDATSGGPDKAEDSALRAFLRKRVGKGPAAADAKGAGKADAKGPGGDGAGGTRP